MERDDATKQRTNSGLGVDLPSLRVHAYIDRLYFGKAYPRIHRKLDRPVRYLGRGHRVLFHDQLSAIACAKNTHPGDPKAILAALNHIELDKVCSADSTYKKFLERMAAMGKKRRRKKRVGRGKKDPILDIIDFLERLKKRRRR